MTLSIFQSRKAFSPKGQKFLLGFHRRVATGEAAIHTGWTPNILSSVPERGSELSVYPGLCVLFWRTSVQLCLFPFWDQIQCSGFQIYLIIWCQNLPRKVARP